jgi:hypothetical protein
MSSSRDDVNDFGTFFSDIVEHSTRERVVNQLGDEEMGKLIIESTDVEPNPHR